MTHDTLAALIAEQRNASEIALLQITKLIKNRSKGLKKTQTFLNERELQLIKSFKDRLKESGKLTTDEWLYIKKSKLRVGIKLFFTFILIAILAFFLTLTLIHSI